MGRQADDRPEPVPARCRPSQRVVPAVPTPSGCGAAPLPVSSDQGALPVLRDHGQQRGARAVSPAVATDLAILAHPTQPEGEDDVGAVWPTADPLSPAESPCGPLGMPCVANPRFEEPDAGNPHVRICGESKAVRTAMVGLFRHPGKTWGNRQGRHLKPFTPSAYPTPRALYHYLTILARTVRAKSQMSGDRPSQPLVVVHGLDRYRADSALAEPQSQDVQWYPRENARQLLPDDLFGCAAIRSAGGAEVCRCEQAKETKMARYRCRWGCQTLPT